MQPEKVSLPDSHGRLELGLDYPLKDQIHLEFGGSYEDAEGPESEGKFSFSVGLGNQF